KSILLKPACIAKDAVLIDYEIELERVDNGNMMYYEIEFELGVYEYEAKVNAKTGTIIKFTKQAD
ncbi:MAG: PepSY domain-containing protein, partial [Clostridia bacterium]|nr:PepSY domain-containing protein [Clostridia bacterium]